MSFRSVFIAIFLGTALVVAAFLINARRPATVTDHPTAQAVLATGKCAECHRNLHASVVHEYETSVHATRGVSCLQCHQVVSGQKSREHNGFTINTAVTAANCRSCHEPIYQQYLRSRHAAPSWAAVVGARDFTAEQVAASERYNPGAVNRPPHPLTTLEGGPATQVGCQSCHAVGKPNDDGSIGTCTACHSRHAASVALARLPTTCGQCHMGPDHSQLEIYEESKHGVMFEAQREQLALATRPQQLTTRDMFVPTCATCHMSGLNGQAVTHDPGERLSYYLFAEVTEKRPQFDRAQVAMKSVCLQCHAASLVERVYTQAQSVVAETNTKVTAAKAIVDGLRADGLLGPKKFDQPIDFQYFDLWHYYGRTAKHGAFMGGADFVQWHANYPMLVETVNIRAAAAELRGRNGTKEHR